MRSKKVRFGSVVCGVAIGLASLAPMAVQAADSTMTSTIVTPANAEPTLVSGQVVRYYVDSTGFVSALKIQTGTENTMVHFPNTLGHQLYTTYPVGSKIDVWVTPTPVGWRGHNLWNVVGVGATKPASWMSATVVSPLAVLEAPPYILAGSRMVTITGNLRRLVAGHNGEVLAFILDNGALVRVPPEMRHIAPGYEGSDRITPLFKGAFVEATGYLEAPMYGVLSPYSPRLASNTISVNGRSVGVLGVPMVHRKSDTLFSLDIGGTSMKEDEIASMRMGYTPYTPAPATSTATTTMDNDM